MRIRFAAVLLMAGCSGPGTTFRDVPSDIASAPETATAPDAGRQETVDTLTLEQGLAMAEAGHPDLVAAAARVEAAEGRALQSGLWPNPDLIARMESAPVDDPSRADILLGAEIHLPVGGRVGAAERLALLERDRLRKEIDLRRRELQRQVRSAFAVARFAEEAAKWRRITLEAGEGSATALRRRIELGDATEEEAARAEMEVGRLKVEARKAEALRSLALLDLASSLGRPGLRIARTDGPIDGALEVPALESLLAAIEESPALAGARLDVEAARARIDLASAQGIPDLKLDLLYRRIGETEENAFDVGLSLPLPLFDRNQGRRDEARAEARAREADVASTRLGLERRMRDAHARLAQSVERLKMLRAEILPRAETIVKAWEARVQSGDVSALDVLLVRRGHADLQLEALEALREVMEAWAVLRSL